MKNKNLVKDINTSQKSFSDQEVYYLNHLKKQQKAINNKFSILGRHHNNLDTFIRNEVQMLPVGNKIIDVGCGLSAWTSKKLREKYNISGIDGEPDAISVCKKIYKGQDYKVGTAYDLPYKNNSFNAVIMREVIEHFKKPERAIKEIERILKPGGIFIVTTPNYNSLLLHVIEHTYNRFFGGECKPYRNDVHPSKFNLYTLKRLLSKYFAVERVETIDYGISLTAVARKKAQ